MSAQDILLQGQSDVSQVLNVLPQVLQVGNVFPNWDTPGREAFFGATLKF